MRKSFWLTMVVVCVFTALVGCSRSTRNVPEGTLKIYLTDAPTGYDAVNIVVSEVSVHMAGQDSASGWTVVCDSTQMFDLLQLRNGAMALFADQQLQAGHYTQIRLKIADGCSVVVEGTPYALTVPSGYQSGVKINHQFVIEEDITYELLLDFDAEKSIVEKGTGEYQMKPVIRAIAVATSGSISGTVDPKSAEALALTDPDTSAHAHTDASGYFKLVGLSEGTYSVRVVPDDVTYADTTFTDVPVTAGLTTDLGTVQLRKE